jgi:hypothetical protein
LWDAEVIAAALHQQRSGGRRQDAAEQRLSTSRRDARRHRGFEHRPRFTGIADHEHARWRSALDAGGRGARQGERQLGGEELARDAAYAVRAEELPRGRAGRSHYRLEN